MRAAPPITTAEADRMFRYNPETGLLYHKKRPPSMFNNAPDFVWQGWNARWAGKEAGSPTPDGRLRVSVSGVPIAVERIIWLLMYDEWPAGSGPNKLVHINGKKADNRLCNLAIKSSLPSNGINAAPQVFRPPTREARLRIREAHAEYKDLRRQLFPMNNPQIVHRGKRKEAAQKALVLLQELADLWPEFAGSDQYQKENAKWDKWFRHNYPEEAA